MSQLKLDDHSHRRYNPLLQQWVLVSPHRAKRPWSGLEDPPQNITIPSYSETCQLCPNNKRANGEYNPNYQTQFCFDNDFAALQQDTPQQTITNGLLVAQGVSGVSRVICFSPDHSKSLPLLELSELESLIKLWQQQAAELGENYPWVQVFENKGQLMGASQPHPHGQIWANSFIPNLPLKKHHSQAIYYQQHHHKLLLDYLNQEIALQQRIVAINDDWLVVVPYWAEWPFETLLLPRSSIANFAELNNHQISNLAIIIKELTTKYDNLFQCSFPYSMGWHGAPYLQEDAVENYWQLHASFLPPLLRSASIKKFMVGYEMLAEAQRDITPEQAAQLLAQQSNIHYSLQS